MRIAYIRYAYLSNLRIYHRFLICDIHSMLILHIHYRSTIYVHYIFTCAQYMLQIHYIYSLRSTKHVHKRCSLQVHNNMFTIQVHCSTCSQHIFITQTHNICSLCKSIMRAYKALLQVHNNMFTTG